MSEERYNAEIKAFGERVAELRKERKWVQLDLEMETGINRESISRIENGNKNVEFMTIVKLAEAFEVELADLFTKGKPKK